MRRTDLEHIIRASAGNADCDDIVIIGSQSLLASFPEATGLLTESVEADVFIQGDAQATNLIEGAIGEGSLFHQTFGYFAHAVGPETAILPDGALQRLIPIKNENTRGATGWCLEPHDLAVSKLVAGRPKDIAFVAEMLRLGYIQPEVIEARIATLKEHHRAPARDRMSRLITI